MLYTQRHFKDVAALISSLDDQTLKASMWEILNKHFAEDNEKFKYDLFRKACGLD